MPIVANNDPEPFDASYYEIIERLIISAMVHDKHAWRERMTRLKTNEQAEQMVAELKELQPIVGYHSLPTDVGDCVEATRRRVERDNFYDRTL